MHAHFAKVLEIFGLKEKKKAVYIHDLVADSVHINSHIDHASHVENMQSSLIMFNRVIFRFSFPNSSCKSGLLLQLKSQKGFLILNILA